MNDNFDDEEGLNLDAALDQINQTLARGFLRLQDKKKKDFYSNFFKESLVKGKTLH